MSSTNPPRVAVWLIARAAPLAERRFLLADLEESYREREGRQGGAAARGWYWAQVRASLGPLLLRRVGVTTLARALRRGRLLSDVGGDVRLALRRARHAPGLTAAVIATMVLGIGATTALFSVLNGVLLQPLPFPESERAVRLGTLLRGGMETSNVAYEDLQDYRRGVRTFAALSGYSVETVTFGLGGDPLSVRIMQVDSSYASVLGLVPAHGRWFDGGSFVNGAGHELILTHATWQTHFGGDAGVVGRTVRVDDVPWQIVGVLPRAAYIYPERDFAAISPLVVPEGSFLRNRGSLWMGAIGRLHPEATLEQARLETAAIGKRLEQEFPDANGGITPTLEPLREVVVGPVRDMLVLLAGAVAAVLLIACANVANLLLGHSHARTRELSVRSALGGGGWRIRRQLLIESLVLALAGGALGLALAPVLTQSLIALYPGTLPRVDAVRLDRGVLALALTATVIAGLLAGVPAARRAAGLDLARDLRDGTRGTAGRSRRRFTSALVVAQVAFTLVLLSAGGLLVQTFVRLAHVEPGFDAQGVLTFLLTTPQARYGTRAEVEQFYTTLDASLAAIPGVDGVATTTYLPFGGSYVRDVFFRREVGDRGQDNPWAFVRAVTPDYHDVMHIPIVRGRGLDPRSPEAREVLVSESLARQIWGEDDPVGSHIAYGLGDPWQVVGISGAVQGQTLWDEPERELIVPSSIIFSRTRFILVRAEATGAILPQVREAVRALDSALPLVDVATMEERLAGSLAPQRFRATLIGMLAAVALLLSAVGVYGVIAHSVGGRTREIGIRLALGDHARGVRRRILGDSLRVVGVGIAAGVVLCVVAGRWLAGFLVGVRPLDPFTLGAVSLLLVAVAILAADRPARRASRISPVESMRSE